ncbi:conserved hypothetical protein [Candidatus Terasakiella magnetica]|uniref:Heparinase II/III-like C-terminal domain-containing protein n=1 Tax=Candidatus Terasakiella magnetica TaxID=1867952 RepID=A0A1C3RG25_9PROT|nr:heparinase II/III family protein [Candidatus Terasakiella magnetica]SCA56209.1 conserved hypothetical protein [Candidatus Terasakiella magnetica]
MSLDNNENIHEPPFLQKWVNRLRALTYRSPLYLITLKKRKQLEIEPIPKALFNLRVGHGRSLKSGSFPFAGRIYKSGDQPWTTAQDDQAWQNWIHGFYWLGDLCEYEDAEAILKARAYVKNWLDLHGVWSPLAWRADVIGDRLVSWMYNAPKLVANADKDFIESFYTSLSLQGSHLSRSYFNDLSGYNLLKALRGQLYVCLFIKDRQKRFNKTLARLGGEFDKQILADGGHISRCPITLFHTMRMALELVDVFEEMQIECPKAIRLCIDRMAPMIRTLRHSDGALALFHGGQEGNAQDIEELLDRTGNQGTPLSDARHSGFQRVEAGRSVLLMDVAAPPDINSHSFGHAAPLSLEISHGEERLLVNCGSVLGGDPSWQEALAATAAHNTLTVDDKNCLSLLHGGGIKPQHVNVTYQRYEDNGQILIDTSHDAYKNTMGLIHGRSVYINKTGDDIRVEDKLTGMGGSSYAISLHLHPDIHASLVQDGQAALLKMQNGIGWHLRVQGGKLDMRESIYVGQPGEMRHTDQIIIQGPLRGEGALIKWRLSRVGG